MKTLKEFFLEDVASGKALTEGRRSPKNTDVVQSAVAALGLKKDMFEAPKGKQTSFGSQYELDVSPKHMNGMMKLFFKRVYLELQFQALAEKEVEKYGYSHFVRATFRYDSNEGGSNGVSLPHPENVVVSITDGSAKKVKDMK